MYDLCLSQISQVGVGCGVGAQILERWLYLRGSSAALIATETLLCFMEFAADACEVDGLHGLCGQRVVQCSSSRKKRGGCHTTRV